MEKIKQKAVGLFLFFAYLVKWLLLSGVTGAAVGAIGAGFIWLLNTASGFAAGFSYYYLFLPIGMFLSAFAVKHLAPGAEGHGTEKAIEAIHKRGGRIKLGVVPVKIIATVITIGSGGSAGKEGPTTQIGAGAASFLAGLFHLDEKDTKRLVVAGMAAAFAAIFGTPVAAAIFAIEVLIVGRIDLKNIFPVMIASLAGYFVSSAFGIETEKMPEIFLTLAWNNALPTVGIALGAGIFFGLVSMLTILVLGGTHKIANKIKIYKPLKGLIGGAAIVLLALVFGTDYLGMGIGYFTRIIGGDPARGYDFLLKIVFTAITLSFGGSGGILTPLMFIGITSGSAFAALFHLDPVVFSALGMLAVLASATNTPLACIVMAFEMFLNPSLAVLAAVACSIAYIVTGHRSVYPTQMMKESKITGVWLESETAEHPSERFIYSRWLEKLREWGKKKK
ncbi:MAG: chloride channel protein [Clostridiales bacterium]|jgi:H+/Cl- antiporter ClcA|nr:chloride channel protein [Clostridiales bacterium]